MPLPAPAMAEKPRLRLDPGLQTCLFFLVFWLLNFFPVIEVFGFSFSSSTMICFPFIIAGIAAAGAEVCHLPKHFHLGDRASDTLLAKRWVWFGIISLSETRKHFYDPRATRRWGTEREDQNSVLQTQKNDRSQRAWHHLTKFFSWNNNQFLLQVCFCAVCMHVLTMSRFSSSVIL